MITKVPTSPLFAYITGVAATPVLATDRVRAHLGAAVARDKPIGVPRDGPIVRSLIAALNRETSAKAVTTALSRVGMPPPAPGAAQSTADADVVCDFLYRCHTSKAPLYVTASLSELWVALTSRGSVDVVGLKEALGPLTTAITGDGATRSLNLFEGYKPRGAAVASLNSRLTGVQVLPGKIDTLTGSTSTLEAALASSTLLTFLHDMPALAKKGPEVLAAAQGLITNERSKVDLLAAQRAVGAFILWWYAHASSLWVEMLLRRVLSHPTLRYIKQTLLPVDVNRAVDEAERALAPFTKLPAILSDSVADFGEAAPVAVDTLGTSPLPLWIMPAAVLRQMQTVTRTRSSKSDALRSTKVPTLDGTGSTDTVERDAASLAAAVTRSATAGQPLAYLDMFTAASSASGELVLGVMLANRLALWRSLKTFATGQGAMVDQIAYQAYNVVSSLWATPNAKSPFTGGAVFDRIVVHEGGKSNMPVSGAINLQLVPVTGYRDSYGVPALLERADVTALPRASVFPGAVPRSGTVDVPVPTDSATVVALMSPAAVTDPALYAPIAADEAPPLDAFVFPNTVEAWCAELGIRPQHLANFVRADATVWAHVLTADAQGVRPVGGSFVARSPALAERVDSTVLNLPSTPISEVVVHDEDMLTAAAVVAEETYLLSPKRDDLGASLAL